MSRRLNAALVIVPALLAASVPALGSDYCDLLQARMNQMPEIVGSGTAVNMKAESVFRLNRMETSIRRDMRALRCPSASMITFGGAEAEDCSRLGEELHQVRAERAALRDLKPILSQTVDDGTGLLPALLQEMKKAHCETASASGQVEVISTRTEEALPLQDAAVSSEDDALDTQQQDVSALDSAPQEYGMASAGGYDDADGVPPTQGEPLTEVELPKLENSDVIQGSGSIDTLRKPDRSTAMAPAPAPVLPSVPDRDYNPHDTKVRRVGPAFLADQDTGIDLRHPADPAASN